MTQHYKLKAANTIQNFFIAWGCLVLLSIHLVVSLLLFYISVHNLIASGPHLQVMLLIFVQLYITHFVIRQLMHRWCPLQVLDVWLNCVSLRFPCLLKCCPLQIPITNSPHTLHYSPNKHMLQVKVLVWKIFTSKQCQFKGCCNRLS